MEENAPIDLTALPYPDLVDLLATRAHAEIAASVATENRRNAQLFREDRLLRIIGENR